MATPTQDGRLLAVTTPLGKDVLLLETFTGVESLSQPFRFTLDMIVDAQTQTVAFDKLLGQPIGVRLQQGDSSVRHFHGILSRFSQGSRFTGPRGGDNYIRYRAEIVPKFHLLARIRRSRIYQQLNVVDILKNVLTGIDVTWELQGTFEPRDYCTQYRESDFEFACRLMEEEGIYYYFVHEESKHLMIVSNVPGSHRDVLAPSTIPYHDALTGNRAKSRIHEWEKVQEVRSGKTTLWDDNFELPGKNLEATTSILNTVQVGTVAHKLAVGGNDRFELYDFPGGYSQRFDGIAPGGGERAADLQKIFQDNARTVGIRMQQEAVESILIHGASDCTQLAAGHKFSLADHFDGNGGYVLTGVQHMANQAGVYTSGDVDATYSNRFTAIPVALPFRPQRLTPKAMVLGPQTATVVGPDNEEIFTDKYGRVKVQFHWDRQGKNDADSSCWVRVATLWAGKQWGMIHIPRIGQEVIVAFEEGDPDCPIIVGSVYNAEQMPPYMLPDNRTQSGVKSRSSLKGTEEHFNELRFEDKKDVEEVYFHAQRDFVRIVENNDTLIAGSKDHNDNLRKVNVFNNQTTYVGSGETDAKEGTDLFFVWNSQAVHIGYGKTNAQEGSQYVGIWKDRKTELETGSDQLLIKTGNQTTEIKAGNQTTEISKGNYEVKIAMGKAKISAMQSIEFVVGQSSITIDQKGVTIKGIAMNIEGMVKTDVKGVMTTVTGSGMCKLGGGITMLG